MLKWFWDDETNDFVITNTYMEKYRDDGPMGSGWEYEREATVVIRMTAEQAVLLQSSLFCAMEKSKEKKDQQLATLIKEKANLQRKIEQVNHKVQLLKE